MPSPGGEVDMAMWTCFPLVPMSTASCHKVALSLVPVADVWICAAAGYREPHMETAVVYAVRPTSLLVFVPKFHLKGMVHVADRAGLVLLPLTGSGQEQLQDDAFEMSHRRGFRLHSGLSMAW